MSINGDFKNLKNLEIDERVYLLIAALWIDKRVFNIKYPC